MARFIKCLLICVLTLAITGASVYSKEEGTTADIYRLYKIKEIPSVEQEALLLDTITDSFTALATKVAGYDMLSNAAEEYSIQYKELLKSFDVDIYNIEETIKLSEVKLKSSGNATVTEIMRLDAQHRTLLSEYYLKIKQREDLVAQLSTVYIPDINIDKDRRELKNVTEDLEKQRENYEKSLSYSKVGEVGKNRFPLNTSTAITSAFGWRLDPIDKIEMQFHKGADMTASAGTTVLAQFNGIVEDTRDTVNGGLTIVLDHGDGVRTVYLHLDKFIVKKGDYVKQYSPIALSGNTGKRTTGPHLHFGIWIGGEAVDPALIYK